jgi:oligopeptide/dipeptide ABC transporter ATP-binding protein
MGSCPHSSPGGRGYRHHRAQKKTPLNHLCSMKDLQAKRGRAIVLITHDLGVVAGMADRVHVMYAGRLVETAQTLALFENPLHPYTRALLSAVTVPDPRIEFQRGRIVLVGDVPSPSNPPPGCAFHPRCPEMDKVPGDRCSTELPLLPTAAMQGRATACHLITDVVPLSRLAADRVSLRYGAGPLTARAQPRTRGHAFRTPWSGRARVPGAPRGCPAPRRTRRARPRAHPGPAGRTRSS